MLIDFKSPIDKSNNYDIFKIGSVSLLRDNYNKKQLYISDFNF